MENTSITDCLCLTCGTTEQLNSTGYCRNNHDNWYEGEREFFPYFISEAQKLSSRNGITLLELNNKLRGNKTWKGLTKD